MSLYTMMVMGMCALKAKFFELKNNENGGAEIIAMVVLIAIVVVLGVAFKDKIVDLIKNIWAGIDPSSVNDPVDIGK